MLADMRQTVTATFVSLSSYLPLGRDKHDYASLPTSTSTSAASSTPGTSPRLAHGAGASPLLSRRRVKILIAIGGTAATLLLLLGLARHGVLPLPIPDGSKRYPEWWGKTEQMGWTEDESLNDLGEMGEEAYHLGFEREDTSDWYYRTLTEFANSLPSPIAHPILAGLDAHFPRDESDLINGNSAWTSMASHKTIFMTDITIDTAAAAISDWTHLNGPHGWSVRFFNDADAQSWMEAHFAESTVEWAWDFMKRGVLRADFLRYMLPLIDGGVYTDVDTYPLKRIDDWGQLNVEYLNISATDGPDWRARVHDEPAVVVGIEVDVHAHPHWKENGWLRPVQMCQWTLGGAPYHPIYLDAVRRVVNATHVVADWEVSRDVEVMRLKAEGKWSEAVDVAAWTDSRAMNVIEWTGPALFTDAVMAFLLARYNVTWHRLRHLDHPLRIGDVLILPITAFSPGGEPDFHAGGSGDKQAVLLHDFRGSWKDDGAR